MDADTVYTIAIVLFCVGVVTVIINIGLLWLNFKIYTRNLERGIRGYQRSRQREKYNDDDW